ncbi:GRF-type domain-containing protein [Abeliophyllum distichum]|uniref:GRF-type domain-containing protein n=1 Tax=Abeliophyllum distichum TaxID=126358 RepID=A0ABD1RXS8_9LAMI
MENSHCSQMVKQRICHCGHVPVMKTSWTEGNPGRRFWGCRFYGKAQACNYFDWADPAPHDRYKCVINGLLRKKNEAHKEKEKMSKTISIYHVVFSLLVLYFAFWVLF